MIVLLATSNAQGELAPLEIGLHALKAVPPEKGGRGKKGGLSEYAKRMGKTHQYLSQLREAAEVLRFVMEGKPASQLAPFLDKAQHLAAVHKAEPAVWPALVGAMLSMWLACHNQQVIGDAVGVTGETVSTFLQKIQKSLHGGKSEKSAKHDDGFEAEVQVPDAKIAVLLGVARPTVAAWFTTNVADNKGCNPLPDSRIKIPAVEKP